MKPAKAAALIILATAPVMALAQGSAEQGRELARKHCSRCHVVGDYNPMGGIGSTPSLQLLVNAFEDYQTRFETFYQRRPHPAFIRVEGYPRDSTLPPNAAPVTIQLDDVDDIVAFVETLKEKK